jgi:nicotinamide mononucleotide (NMN) deamidase PncC
MGIDDETLEAAVNALLAARGWTLAITETLTGGMIAQHLTAQGASQLLGGRSYARRVSDDDAARLAETARAEWGSDCGLGVVGDIEKRETRAVFLSPEGAVEWTLGFAGRDERSQVRTTVTVLERIRRHLAGTPAVEP